MGCCSCWCCACRCCRSKAHTVRQGRGGGPAPVLENPSISLCVIMMLANLIEFAICSAGVLSAQLLAESCSSAQLTVFITVVGTESAICGSFFMYLSCIEYASDGSWFRYASLTIVVNVLQVVTMVVGVYNVWAASQDETCKEEAPVVLNFTIVLTMYFSVVATFTFLLVKFVFLPSLALQLRNLRKFK